MKTAQELKKIADEFQDNLELIKIILKDCEKAATMGEYEKEFEGLLAIDEKNYIYKNICFQGHENLLIDYNSLKSQLKTLGYHLSIENIDIGRTLYNNILWSEIIITISWRE